jgi:hypothetical protein
VGAADELLDGFGEVCDVLVPLVESAAMHLTQGVQLGPADRFRLIGRVLPGQRWAYQPGEQVRCVIKVLSRTEAHWLAVGRYDAEPLYSPGCQVPGPSAQPDSAKKWNRVGVTTSGTNPPLARVP